MTDMITADAETQTASYLATYNFNEYIDYVRYSYTDLHAILDQDRCSERYVRQMNNMSWEFEDANVGGRGLAYNAAQKRIDNRQIGMTKLLKCFSSTYADVPDLRFRILDVLGGDGTFARFCRTLGRHAPQIYTADISKFMVDACHAQGLPCVRQSATNSLFRDNVLDGVIIAYGAHHLDSVERQLAVNEAHRTLKAGGRLILHDFEIGRRSANWFKNIVHPFSRTGHPHEHFSRQEMFQLFTSAGFRDVRVFEISDPFTLYGNSPEEAKSSAIAHMYDMYDLIKLAELHGDVAPHLERHITETLGPISIQREERRYVAQIPRYALVAVGEKYSYDS